MQSSKTTAPIEGANTNLNEDLRLSALDNLDLLDTPREEAFDRIARLIRYSFKVPVALVSLMDGHRQWHKACIGLGEGEAERKDTFCRIPVASGEPLVILDATRNPLTADNPHVTGENGIRFYAGVPLKLADGLVIGTVCAIDFVPRGFQKEDLEALQDLTAIVLREIELRQLAEIDFLTGILTRPALKEQAWNAAKLAIRHNHALSCLAIDIDHFKTINDTHGHAAGDEDLKAIASACSKTIRETDVIGRLGGEEFAVILPQTNHKGALEAAEKLRSAVQHLKVEVGNVCLQVTASVGVASLDPYLGDMDLLLAQADEAMYAAKRAGRNRIVVWRGVGSTKHRVLKAGRIFFHDRHHAVDFTIRSLSDNAAGLDVWRADDLPDRFTLAIGQDGNEQECRVISRSHKHVEVNFV